MVVTKGFAKGFTMEQHAAFRKEPGKYITQINTEISYTLLEEIDGAQVIHQKIKMPMFITNRSSISIFYTMENDDGSVVFFNTSHGNEDLYEKYKDKVGSDVIAINHFGYTKVAAKDDGVEYVQVACTDIAGSIPDMLKAKSGGRMLRAPEKLIHLLMGGKAEKE